MKSIRGVVLVILMAMAVGACFDPPEFPVVPEIEFESIQFKDLPDPNADSLILKIAFRDGDGDLGLFADELGCYDIGGKQVCYNSKFFFVKISDGTPVTYADKRTNPDFASLPEFVSPYNCINWEVVRDNDNIVTDTVYFELNPDHYNIFVDFLVKQNDGTFQLFDLQTEIPYPSCGGTYNGRFPVLSRDLSKPTPLEGTIRYVMQSPAFLLQFSIKTLKLRVRIQDRILNSSNTIETPEFTLQSIKS